MTENIKKIYLTAKTIESSDKVNDIDACKVELLFPCFETILGYDTTRVGDIVIAPAYTMDGSFKLDYGLRGNEENQFKSCFKIVKYGDKLDDNLDKIKECVETITTEFVVITDCINYSFYAVEKDELVLIGDYSFVNEKGDDKLFSLIKCPSEGKRQEFAVGYDDDEEQSPGFYDNYDENERSVGYRRDEEDEFIPKKKKRKNKSKTKLIILAGIIVSVIIFLMGLFIFSGDTINNFFASLDRASEMDVIEKGLLDGTLEISADEMTDTLHITLVSKNIPSGAKIKYVITSSLNQEIIYDTLNNDGTSNIDFVVPQHWDDPNITIVSYLRFDELTQQQPSNVKKKFGEIGDKIIAKDGAPDKFTITYTTVKYDTEAAKLKRQAEEEARLELERQERIKLFSDLEIRVDALGNWKVLPKGFDMNEVNIMESRRIYPQIFYDGKEDQPYFYLICGTINQMQVIRFTDVIFYADGFQWSYQVSTNTKDISVTGGVAKEWVYFHNINTPTLVSDTNLLATSEVSKVTFRGDKIMEHVLSNKEKKYLVDMITAYQKYFNTGEKPNPVWLDEVKQATNK